MPEEKKCPRCLTASLEKPAVSGHDDETLICATCGEEEGLLNHVGENRSLVTPEMIEREKRIPLKRSGRWFAYWPDKERPLWLEQILLRDDPSQSIQ
jgi:hypothetical protein